MESQNQSEGQSGQNLSSIYPEPNMQSQISETDDDSLNKSPSKGSGFKVFLIIFVIIVILGLVGYFIFKKSSSDTSNPSSTASSANSSKESTLTINGESESMTVSVPSGYKVYDGKDTKIIYNPKVTTSEELKKGIANAFMVNFIKINDTNNVEAEAVNIKASIEGFYQQATGNKTITKTKVNSIVAYKYEGQGVAPIENNFITDYYLITPKSVFVISSVSTLDKSNLAQKEFDEILNSVKITVK